MNRLLIFVLLFTSLSGAVSKHTRHRWPGSPIAGSRLSMDLQNQEIDNLRLPRIVDDQQLHQLEETGELIPVTAKVVIAPNLKQDRVYLRPWAEQFLEQMADDFVRIWKTPLRLNSAVRTMEQQHELRKHNRYAADETRSSHLAGITFDLAKRKYTRKQRKWIVSYLKNYMNLGYITAAEEPACFHIAVLQEYLYAKY